MENEAGPERVAFTRTPLLATKLYIPRLRANGAPRQRLLDRLNLGLDRQLVLISAPAGFGKTTVLASWVRSLACQVAWLTLDEADNDPLRLLRYLAGALHQIEPGIGHELDDVLDAPRPLPAAALAATLVNAVSRIATDFVLALDDFHTLDDQNALELVRTLVAHQPPALHLAIATREDPPLPLARLRGLDQLVELRAQDLRFTYDETAAFLHTAMGLDLAAEDVRRLDARVEGWAAGLQLAGLSLQASDDPSALIARISGSQHFILSYLTTEVLSGLADDVRRFLLDTAVLDRLCAPLCVAVTGRSDSAALLEGLYRSNVFLIPLDDEHRWFHYHPLFADLLRGMLTSAEPGRAARLHTAASAWYEQEGDGVAAVEHAFAAADYPLVVRLLERYARPLVLQGYPQTVEGWLRRLPPDEQKAGPRAALAFAWSLLLRGRLEEIDAWLAVAEQVAATTAGERASLLAESQALRAGLTSLRGEHELACTLAEQAVAQCPPQDSYVQGMARFCLATAYNYAGRTREAITAYQAALPLCQAGGMTMAAMLIVANLAVLHLAHGRLQAALDLCQQVIEAADGTPGVRSPSLAAIYGNFTIVLYARNEIDAAYRMAQQWLELSRRGGHSAAIAFGMVVLSRCELARGDLPAAQRALAEAVPALKLGIPGWVASEVVSQQVAMALAQGDEAAAAVALQQAGVTAALPINYATEVLHVARLSLLVQSRQPDLRAAEALANELLASAEPAGRMAVVLQVLLLRAQLLAVQDQQAQAIQDVERALELAEPEGYVRVFVNAGMALLPLLRAAHRHRAYAASVIAAIAPAERHTPASAADAPAAAPDPLVEPLTTRELEVLRLIAAGLTYQEIADRQVVSLNTVRFHVKSIYGKLGVDKRFAAITRATALGLL